MLKLCKFKYIKVWLICFFTLISTCLFSQQEEIEEVVVDTIKRNRNIIFYHQYAIEHSFADFTYVPKGITAKTDLSGTPLFGIGVKYKINDVSLFGGQTFWGLQRNNMKVFDDISNKDIVYSIDYWCFKNAIAYSLKLNENHSLSFLLINSSNLLVSGYSSSIKNLTQKFENELQIQTDTFKIENRIGIEYELKPFKERNEKLFWQLEIPLKQRKIITRNYQKKGGNSNEPIYYQPIIITFGLRF